MAQKKLTVEAAVIRAQKYCLYQERCTKQVEAWLKRFGIEGGLAASVMKELVNEGFLNDERFACAFARGKFRINGWGRAKIIRGLRALSLNEELIGKGLGQIDDDEYCQKLEKLIEKKIGLAGDKELSFEDKMKVSSWAFSRGFEKELITRIIERF